MYFLARSYTSTSDSPKFYNTKMIEIAKYVFGIFLLVVMGAPAPVLAQPFEPDQNTTFLAHLENNQSADYALGWRDFGGNGATVVEGYYGKALDLRKRAILPNYEETCNELSPLYQGWGFYPRGNVNPWQGTYECWFRVAEPGQERMVVAGDLMGASITRIAREEGDKRYSSITVDVNSHGIRFLLPLVSGRYFKGSVTFRNVPGFNKSLDPRDWHHYALTWSQGEMVMWLDGRPVQAWDMTGHYGLAYVVNPAFYAHSADIVKDELRISNVVRYHEPFEPRWRDGKRPDYAFTGVPDVKRFDPKLESQPAPSVKSVSAPKQTFTFNQNGVVLTFDRTAGQLTSLKAHGNATAPTAGGLILSDGVGRKPMSPQKITRIHDDQEAGRLMFDQQFSRGIAARHELGSTDAGALEWRITLTNNADEERWIEPLIGLPVPLKSVSAVFDGAETKTQLELPRHRDLYKSTLPFVAATDGKRYIGVGIDPHIALSDIVHQWAPDKKTPTLRQGTKIALSPGESFTLTWFIVAGDGEFGTLDALNAYHEQSPDLYRLQPDVPTYSYMPATQDYHLVNHNDNKRMHYAGGFWRHGPGHGKGDDFGTPELWANPEFDRFKVYAYTRRLENLWKSVDALREAIRLSFKAPFDNFYTVGRRHYCPDLTPSYLVYHIWPGHTPNDDPLSFGQYYRFVNDKYIVNEYGTPFGKFYNQMTRRYLRHISGTSPGFINDMSHAGSLMRFNDEFAKKTSGRSFSRDLGTFVRKSLGRQARYELINSFVDNGHRASIWSDAGAFSYTLCAYSSQIAIEGGGMFRNLFGTHEYMYGARPMLGEKSLTSMTHYYDDWIGHYISKEDFKMLKSSKVRDYYRYVSRQLGLMAIRDGVTLGASTYLWGKQPLAEMNPLLVESTVLGRKVIPAARVDEPLWLCRAGNGLDTLFVIGNHEPKKLSSDVTIHNRYFGDQTHLLADVHGAKVSQTVSRDISVVKNLKVERRDLRALKAIAAIDSAGRGTASTTMSGDGLTMRIRLSLQIDKPAVVRLNTFAPMYQLTGLTHNGRAIGYDADYPLQINAGKHELEWQMQHEALHFPADQWAKVDLIDLKNNRTNFCIIADQGRHLKFHEESPLAYPIGFERGTAEMLNDFLYQFDTEDGHPENLNKAAVVKTAPADYAGWIVRLTEDAGLPLGRVRIEDASRTIHIEGPTQGQMRRAMVVFMRLIDRKYPHIGRFQPMRSFRRFYAHGEKIDFSDKRKKWMVRAKSSDFYAQLDDPMFILKPILNSKYEGLYADGNVDFAGKYQLKTTSYLFEPTYDETFVYGYHGSGTAEVTEKTIVHQPKVSEAD